MPMRPSIFSKIFPIMLDNRLRNGPKVIMCLTIINLVSEKTAVLLTAFLFLARLLIKLLSTRREKYIAVLLILRKLSTLFIETVFGKNYLIKVLRARKLNCYEQCINALSHVFVLSVVFLFWRKPSLFMVVFIKLDNIAWASTNSDVFLILTFW